MDKRSAYTRLGLEEGATERAVRRAYRAELFALEDARTTDVEYPEKRASLDEALEVCLRYAPSAREDEAAPDPGGAKEPLTHRQLGLRLAGGLLGIAALIFGFRLFQDAMVDPGGDSPVDTAGWIAAIRETPGGGRVVAIKPDGTAVLPREDGGTHDDREAVWRPDGNRILVLSNREGTPFDVFRWNPADGSIRRRSADPRGKSSLDFTNPRSGENGATGLVAMGGYIYEYDQRLGSFRQVLPPVRGRTVGSAEDGSGSVAQMEALYRSIGESFIEAKWAPDHRLVYATMRREEDEVFVVNPLTREVNEGRPLANFAGRRVEFDVGAEGSVVVAVRDYRFLDPTNVPDEFLIDGRPTPPVTSGVFMIVPGQQPFLLCHARRRGFYLGPLQPDARPQLTHPEREFAFSQPRISPDGRFVVVVLGTVVGEGGFEASGLVLFPLKEGAGQVRQLAGGVVADPSWSPRSDRVVFTMVSPEGRRGIVVAGVDGEELRLVSDDGDFRAPRFSPQPDWSSRLGGGMGSKAAVAIGPDRGDSRSGRILPRVPASPIGSRQGSWCEASSLDSEGGPPSSRERV